MPYEVKYTDSNKGIIVVEDETINTETSMTLPGKRSIGYGQYVAENFLHLLENFANTTPPLRPVEGQLWYDTTEGIDQLKVYDGTGWVSSGGLKKGTQKPGITSSVRGDLWSNTESQQLYLFNGSDWVLVGPEYSDGLLTGTKSQTIVGIDNLEYTVLFIKILDKNVAVISDREFTPKVTVPGFTTIRAGLNINTRTLVNNNNIKYWGVAEKAEALQVTNDPSSGVAVVPANSFLRKDIDAGKQNINVPVEIRDNQGLKIGESSQLSVFASGNNGIIQNNVVGSSISIRMREGNANTTVMYVDSSRRVGINNTAPEETLDIKGNLKLRSKDGSLTEGRLLVENTTNTDELETGSIVTKGGLSVSQNAIVGADLRVDGNITHSGNIIVDKTEEFDIGSSNSRYNSVWATTFNGNLEGNVRGTVIGNVEGAADRLSTATTFSITGDVEDNSFSFDGQTGGTTKQFNVQISNSFIANKDFTPDNKVLGSDEILINRVDSTNNTAGVFKTTKNNLLKDIPTNPVGTVTMYGGDVAPDGWLLCDGSIYTKSDYDELWQIIGHKFLDPSFLPDNGLNTFAVPDFRGRSPIGTDNMGGASANRVSDPEADRVGGSAGSETTAIELENLPDHKHDMQGENAQYYSVRVGNSEDADVGATAIALEVGETVTDGNTTGVQGFTNSGSLVNPSGINEPLNVMNPFLALNFIIYTGK